MHQAKTNLSRLVEHARRGDEVIVERSGHPVAKIVRYDEPSGWASLEGVWKGKVTLADDFDELPDDLADAFDARDG